MPVSTSWSATPSASGHATIGLTRGYVDDGTDYGDGYVALQVLFNDVAPPVVTSGATAGFAQYRKDGYAEKPIITSGDDLVAAGQYVRAGKTTYSARDVIEYLLSGLKPGQVLGTA